MAYPIERDEKSELSKEINQLQRELNAMTTHVTKDVAWGNGVQDQHKSESYSYNEYSDPRKAREIANKLKEKQKALDSYDYREEQARRVEDARQSQLYRESKKELFLTAKSKYDAEMNEYMSKNFIGKSIAIIQKKKPVKLNNRQIMEKFGDSAISEYLEPTLIEMEKRR